MSTLLVRVIILSVVCLLPRIAAANSPSIPGSSDPETLTIFLKGDSGSDGFMRAEVARLMAPTGLRVEWKAMAERKVGVDYERLVSLELRGSCSASVVPANTNWNGDVRSLAWTSVADGRVLPFATVECDNLRKMMSGTLAGARRSEWAGLFGRAMARVIAHELFHMLAQTKHHHSAGVSKACFRVSDLTADRFDFDDVTIGMLRPPEPASSSSYDGFYEEAAGR